MGGQVQASGPELRDGVATSDVPEGGMLPCRVGDEPVLLVRAEGRFHAVGAACTHYGAPLSDGALIGNELHCPWHHACFDVRSGTAVGPPALRPIDTWELKVDGDRVRALGKRTPAPVAEKTGPSSVLVVGAGAAGDALAATLRELGYAGAITLFSRDAEGVPVDRPNLSKDYLDGGAPEEWIPLRGAEFYESKGISLCPEQTVTSVDVAAHSVTTADGTTHRYGALVLATGATPIRLDLPGANLPHVHALRTLDDARAIIAGAKATTRAVVLGSSFIGLEAAASLRKRGLEVHVVSPDAVPLGRVLGPELGAFVRSLHEEKGVVFHLGRKPAAITPDAVTLDDGTSIAAGLVVMGVGVRPNTGLAETAGIRVNNGVFVDAGFKTSAPDVYAVGDIARFPSGGGEARIEHWSVAQHHGRQLAHHLVGAPVRPFVPFFWSQHYDVPVNYVGHAPKWDSLTIAGSIEGRDCLVAYREAGRIVAVASIYRDRQSLLAEDALARGDQAALEALLVS